MSFDLSAYVDAFREESEEHLQRLMTGVPDLEQRATDVDAIAALFRSAHTIKGGARMMGYTDVAELAHRVEVVLDGLRRGRLPLSREMVDALLAALDGLQRQIDAVTAGANPAAADPVLLARLERLTHANLKPVRPAPAAAAAAAPTEHREDDPSALSAGGPPAAPPPSPAQGEDPGSDPARVQARLPSRLGSEAGPDEGDGGAASRSEASKGWSR